MVYLRVISEAEEFSVISCCDYAYYDYHIDTPWDDSIGDLRDEFINSLSPSSEDG